VTHSHTHKGQVAPLPGRARATVRRGERGGWMEKMPPVHAVGAAQAGHIWHSLRPATASSPSESARRVRRVGAVGFKRALQRVRTQAAGTLAVTLAAEANLRGVDPSSHEEGVDAGRVGARLGCHGTRYVPNAQGWYAYPARTVRGALGASRPAPPVRTQRWRLVRVACTYPTEAPGRTSQLRRPPRRARSSRPP
jgi:hypothetical protein